MKPTGPTNPQLCTLIEELRKAFRKENADIWHRIAEDLSRPTRIRRAVNLSRINRYTKDNETVIVPGKVLGSGELNHKLTVAAWCFSKQAKEKILMSKSTPITIKELMKLNPKGNKVRIIG